MNVVFDFIQTTCVIIVLSYLLSRTNFFSEVRTAGKLSRKKTVITVLVFLFISLYGGLIRSRLVSGMYVDTRIAGITLAGLLFGGGTALPVLLGAGIFTLFLRPSYRSRRWLWRYLLGAISAAVACSIILSIAFALTDGLPAVALAGAVLLNNTAAALLGIPVFLLLTRLPDRPLGYWRRQMDNAPA